MSEEKPKECLVFHIDGHEIACIVTEQMSGFKRPEGMTSTEAVEALDPRTSELVMRVSEAICDYIAAQFTRMEEAKIQ
jgi:hypothetical protein